MTLPPRHVQNAPDGAVGAFDDVATGTVVERALGQAATYAQQGTRRVGGPEIGEPTIQVVGVAATAEQRYDASGWEFENGGQRYAPPTSPAYPVHLLLERSGGDWLVVGTDHQAADTVSC